MTNSLIQRTNMVESQIRPSDVTDRRIMRAMQLVPRERFVPPAMASLAYMDNDVPLFEPGSGAPLPPRSLMSPRNFAKLLQLAGIEPESNVLIVGAGRGYSAAIVAELARSVVALECDAALAEHATAAFADLDSAKLGSAKFGSVRVVVGELSSGHAAAGLYDVIVVDGAIGARPEALLAQLKLGGRLVCVMRSGSVGRATRFLHSGVHIAETVAFEASAGTLPGFDAAPAFVL